MRDKPLFISSIIFFLLYIVFILAVFSPLKHVFSPFVTMFGIVYFFSPIVRKLKKFKIPGVISAVLIYGSVLSLLVFIVLFALPIIYDAIIKVRDILNFYLEKFGIDIFPDKIFSQSIGGMYTTLIRLIKIVTDAFVGAVAAFYILADSGAMRKSLREFVPEELVVSFRLLADDVKVSLDSFFKGQLVIALILFLIDAVFLVAMGIDYALGLAAIAAVLDIIPYAGAFVSTAIIVFVTIVSSPEKTVVVLLGLFLIQQVENNFITPRISSDTLSLHPAVTVLSLYLGAYGGFWGILLAIPLTCIFRKIAERFIQSII